MMRNFTALIGVLGQILLCVGQQIPPTWRSPSFSISRSQRIAVAQGAMDLIAQNITLYSGIADMAPLQAGPVISALAMADLTANTTRYQKPITEVMKVINETNPFTFNTSPANKGTLLNWGIAFVYAHRAYQDLFFLALAEEIWERASANFITEAQAQSGEHPQKNRTISTTCSGASTAGGFFLTNEFYTADTSVSSSTTGQFAALSGHLAEATGNQMYHDAAVLSATFVKNVLTAPSGLIYAGIRLEDCELNMDTELYYSGSAINAWSLLADITKDQTWKDEAVKVMHAATAEEHFAGPDGISELHGNGDLSGPATGPLYEPVVQMGFSYKGLFVGSLYELWTRNAANTTLSAYVEAYVATQFNALRDLASKPGSNYYSSDWHGPAVDYWTPDGVVASTPVLAMALVPKA